MNCVACDKDMDSSRCFVPDSHDFYYFGDGTYSLKINEMKLIIWSSIILNETNIRTMMQGDSLKSEIIIAETKEYTSVHTAYLTLMRYQKLGSFL